MRKMICIFTLALVLVAGLLAPPALRADLPAIDYGQNVGKALADSMVWFASGTSLKGSNLKIDTTFGGTYNDTTYAYDIAGCIQVAVTVISRSRNDDSDFSMYAQVGPENLKTAVWHQLNTAYSVDNTAGAQVSGTADTGRDTTLWLLLNNTLPDTFASAQTGMTVMGHGDQAAVRSNRYLRLWIDPDHAAATDTTTFHTILHRLYPR